MFANITNAIIAAVLGRCNPVSWMGVRTFFIAERVSHIHINPMVLYTRLNMCRKKVALFCSPPNVKVNINQCMYRKTLQ